ncbi:hypothetical protein CJ030_MR2G007125 [Morella rubra]|uniref:Uncharacterized protein n=1 Tax=Morella rubra TaxID=262757 RepID=A0A6A1WLE0_9ROSI|nr:hypothetical protein CJ030_MR2G007125 [Morella rubra]
MGPNYSSVANFWFEHPNNVLHVLIAGSLGVVLLTTSSLPDDGKKPQSPKGHKPPQKHKPPISLDESPEGDNPFDKPPKGKGEKPPSLFYKPPQVKGEKPQPEHKPPHGHYPGHPPVEDAKDSLEPAGKRKPPSPPPPKMAPRINHHPPHHPPCTSQLSALIRSILYGSVFRNNKSRIGCDHFVSVYYKLFDVQRALFFQGIRSLEYFVLGL